MCAWLVLLAGLHLCGMAKSDAWTAGPLDGSVQEPTPPPLYFPPRECMAGRLAFRLGDKWEAVFSQRIWETDRKRCYAQFAQTGACIAHEWYLGDAFGVAIETGVSRGRLSALVTFRWNPMEGVGLHIGYDLLQGQAVGSATFTP
jgi:hypothetical protein